MNDQAFQIVEKVQRGGFFRIIDAKKVPREFFGEEHPYLKVYVSNEFEKFIIPHQWNGQPILEDVLFAVSSVVKSASVEEVSKFFRSIYFVFYDPNTIDVVVDPVPEFRAIYFGKNFVNQKALKRLIYNISAKYTKIRNEKTVVRLHNIEHGE